MARERGRSKHCVNRHLARRGFGVILSDMKETTGLDRTVCELMSSGSLEIAHRSKTRRENLEIEKSFTLGELEEGDSSEPFLV